MTDSTLEHLESARQRLHELASAPRVRPPAHGPAPWLSLLSEGAVTADTAPGEPVAGAPPTRRGPLDGLLVADLSRVLAGPYCSMLLADLGATVIKVESPGGGDTRAWTPPEKDGTATYFMSINRNKRPSG